MNYFKTSLLLAFLTALFMSIGLILGGRTGMMIALVVAIGMDFWALYNSDKAVLRRYGATQINSGDVHRLTQQLATNAGLPMPKLYVLDSDQPNAFATGRNPDNAAVAVSRGLVKLLTPAELGGVIAHELAHIQNRDTLIMTVTATISGAISMLANFGMLSGRNREGNGALMLLSALVAPFAAMLVQMAVSRTREYAADKRGAQICGDPKALATALQKITSGVAKIPSLEAENHPASAHLFIINPLNGQKFDNLFSTHPNTQNRVDALLSMKLK